MLEKGTPDEVFDVFNSLAISVASFLSFTVLIFYVLTWNLFRSLSRVSVTNDEEAAAKAAALNAGSEAPTMYMKNHGLISFLFTCLA